jgi:hypothetical protein
VKRQRRKLGKFLERTGRQISRELATLLSAIEETETELRAEMLDGAVAWAFEQGFAEGSKAKRA